MPGDVNYAHEKYTRARDILAEGLGTPRARLADAYLGQAHRTIPLRPGMGPEISDELAARITSFHARMTSTSPVGPEGSIEATIQAMADDEVQAAMEELVAIANALDWEYHDNRS